MVAIGILRVSDLCHGAGCVVESFSQLLLTPIHVDSCRTTLASRASPEGVCAVALTLIVNLLWPVRELVVAGVPTLHTMACHTSVRRGVPVGDFFWLLPDMVHL